MWPCGLPAAVVPSWQRLQTVTVVSAWSIRALAQPAPWLWQASQLFDVGGWFCGLPMAVCPS